MSMQDVGSYACVAYNIAGERRSNTAIVSLGSQLFVFCLFVCLLVCFLFSCLFFVCLIVCLFVFCLFVS